MKKLNGERQVLYDLTYMGKLKKKKKPHRNRTDWWSTEFVRAGGNWVERAKRRKRAAVRRSGGDVQRGDYSHHTILHLKVAKRVDLKSSPHKKRFCNYMR